MKLASDCKILLLPSDWNSPVNSQFSFVSKILLSVLPLTPPTEPSLPPPPHWSPRPLPCSQNSQTLSNQRESVLKEIKAAALHLPGRGRVLLGIKRAGHVCAWEHHRLPACRRHVKLVLLLSMRASTPVHSKGCQHVRLLCLLKY